MTGNREVPLLLYDGDCRFCAWWVRYWQRLTGARVHYMPFQQARDAAPGLTEAECRRAVQLLDPGGQHLAGAAASFRVLAIGGHGFADSAIRRSRTLARIAEAAYTFVSRRRDAAYLLSRALWGRERHPADYTRASAIFASAIAAIYVAAFASLAVQIRGLVGADGIAPAAGFFDAVARALPERAWLEVPSLFWLADGDPVLVGACVLGAAAAAIAATGRWQLPMFALCYALYLSLFYAGQTFMSFQWDLLLLEAGFLAIFLPLRTRVVPWLYRLLLFRFMFLSGCVKLLSADPSWAALSALDFHYETQPLPTPLAWYAHHLPGWVDRLGVVTTFVVELALPWLIFTPRRPRMIAAGGFLLLETVILLTGNYNFFNLLTMALCLFLFDDAQFGVRAIAPPKVTRPLAARVAIALLAVFIVIQNAFFLARPFSRDADPGYLAAAIKPVMPFHVVNAYGLFAVMTTTRPEIIVQGSANGVDWSDYEFEYKPGDPARGPRWNIPHQPRLDWQMWFAALADAGRTPWFGNFLVRLLQNAPAVTGLLHENPFAAAPPRYVRAMLYDYRYSTPEQRAATGQVWQRRATGQYYPALRLR